jgi:hypothetical protein
MQALEDRTEKSRREMDLHDTIDTVRVLNSRNQHIDIDKVKLFVRFECICPARPLIFSVPLVQFIASNAPDVIGLRSLPLAARRKR